MLADQLDTPIAVDESVYTLYDAHRVITAAAADVVNITLPKCGSIYRSQKITALREGAGISCFMGGCLETTPGKDAVHLQVSRICLVSPFSKLLFC